MLQHQTPSNNATSLICSHTLSNGQQVEEILRRAPQHIDSYLGRSPSAERLQGPLSRCLHRILLLPPLLVLRVKEWLDVWKYVLDDQTNHYFNRIVIKLGGRSPKIENWCIPLL